MAVSDADVNLRANQILAEKGDTPEARAQIAREAQAAGVGAAQLARALNNQFTEADVRRAAAEVDVAFSPASIGNRLASGDIDRDTAQRLLDANVGLPAALNQNQNRNQNQQSGLNAEQQAFLNTLPPSLQDDYQAVIAAGISDPEQIANLLQERGLGFEEAAQTVGLTSQDPLFEQAQGYFGIGPAAPGAGIEGSNLEGSGMYSGAPVETTTFIQYPSGQVGVVEPGFIVPAGVEVISQDQYLEALREGGIASGLLPEDYQLPGTGEQPAAAQGTMATFDYSTFPGGIYGPGQALPNIFTPVTPSAAPGTAPPAAAPGAVPPAALGPTTMVSPGITTYAYPNPFSGVNIFERPAPTPYIPPGQQS